MSRALTQGEKDVFELIRNGEDVALVQTTFDGIETAVIVLIPPTDEDGGGVMIPLAVLGSDEMFDRIAPPDPEMEIIDKRKNPRWSERRRFLEELCEETGSRMGVELAEELDELRAEEDGE